MHKRKILCWDADKSFSGSCFHDPVIAYFVWLWRRKRLWLVDEGIWFGSAQGRLGETSVVGPALTKTAPAQLHLWLPSLRWSPRQTWSCSCGWSHCWSASGSQSCSVRGGETDLGSDSKSGITAKYNPGLSHRDRTVGQWWHKQRADTKAPQHDLIFKTLTHHQSFLFWTHICRFK